MELMSVIAWRHPASRTAASSAKRLGTPSSLPLPTHTITGSYPEAIQRRRARLRSPDSSVACLTATCSAARRRW
jgi:hypothetical protein